MSVQDGRETSAKGPLDSFFVKRKDPPQTHRKPRKSRAFWFSEYETSGSIPSRAEGLFSQKYLELLEPVTLRLPFAENAQRTQPWSFGGLGVPQSVVASPPKDYIASVEFSKEGDRILCAQASGALALIGFDALRIVASCPESTHPSIHSTVESDEEDLRLWAPVDASIHLGHSLKRAIFSPRDSTQVACVGQDYNGVRQFDLGAGGTFMKKQGLRAGKETNVHRKRGGYSDCVMMPSTSPFSVVASTTEAVHAWDDRASCERPVMQLVGPRTSSATAFGQSGTAQISSPHITCIEHSCGGMTLHGGTGAGTIHSWDVRQPNAGTAGNPKGLGITSSPFTPLTNSVSCFAFANQAPTNTPLATLSVSHALRKHGVAIPPLGEVQSLHRNPANEAQLAFTIEGGLTGVVDLLSQGVTHADVPSWMNASNKMHSSTFTDRNNRVMPSSARDEDFTSAPVLLADSQGCCWLPEQQVLVSTSATKEIKFLDLRQKSPFNLNHGRSDHSNDILQPKHSVALGEFPMCACAHPQEDIIVVGSKPSMLTIIDSLGQKSMDQVTQLEQPDPPVMFMHL